MKPIQRKTTPKVVGGKVQRKNRSALTPNYFNTPQDVPRIDRERPGPGHRHVLKKRDIVDFISILPDWDELSQGLDAVLLATAEDDTAGWHYNGVVAVCAWPRELWMDYCRDFYDEHRETLDRLRVPTEKTDGGVLCKYTESTAKAFQLLHILLHELGHHRDRMTTRSKRGGRGENFAEQYALKYEKTIWSRYQEVFGPP